MADHHHHDDEVHDHDRGLAFDLNTMMARRRMLKLFAGGAIAGIGATAAVLPLPSSTRMLTDAAAVSVKPIFTCEALGVTTSPVTAPLATGAGVVTVIAARGEALPAASWASTVTWQGVEQSAPVTEAERPAVDAAL